MADGDLHRRAVSSAPRLTSEEIATRSFATAFRGISEQDVRSYLRRVADEVAHGRERERELAARVAELEEQVRNPPPLTDQQLLEALGEETARVLRSAQEAAEEIRRRADEQAASTLADADERALQARTSADEHAGRLRREAEAAAAALRGDAEREAAEIAARAEQDATAEIGHAKETGRSMVTEAREVRERVLADLARRRAHVQAQLEELRAGRDRLLAAYRTVKQTLADATAALAAVETRPPDAEPPTPPEVRPTAEPGSEARPSVGGTEAGPAPAGDVEDHGDLDGDEDVPDVDSLFAKLRAEREAAVDRARGELAAREAAAASREGAAGAEAPAAEGPPEEQPRPGAGRSEQRAWEARDAAVAPAHRAAAKRAKRALQDEQNELLAAVRTHRRGAPAPEDVLPAADAQVDAWTGVLRDVVGEVYRGGFRSVGAAYTPGAAPPELVESLARDLVSPLRDRLVTTIAAGTEIGTDEAADDTDLGQRIGARYREWKGAPIDDALGDALAAAWARGVYDAAPDGARLRWLAPRDGGCPDCDDNGLEPTRKGERFPTGQPHPPAHAGCRCLLLVEAEGVPPES